MGADRGLLPLATHQAHIEGAIDPAPGTPNPARRDRAADLPGVRARRHRFMISKAWDRLAALRWYLRWPAKLALFAVVLLLILFPRLDLLARELHNLRHTEELIQPDLPAMAEINREVDKLAPANATRQQEFKAVERFVYQRIKYQYDWYNWGNIDYWPTAAEVWERQREDCDGRAVLAASILQSRGFKSARLVANVNHVWVAVEQDELMGPQADKNFRKVNGKTVLSAPKWRTIEDSIAMLSRFPASRSMAVLFTVALLCYHPCRHRTGFFVVTTTGLAGLILLLDWGNAHLTNEIGVGRGQFAAAIVLLTAAAGMALAMNRWLQARLR
jgi:hypothetical protein